MDVTATAGLTAQGGNNIGGAVERHPRRRPRSQLQCVFSAQLCGRVRRYRWTTGADAALLAGDSLEPRCRRRLAAHLARRRRCGRPLEGSSGRVPAVLAGEEVQAAGVVSDAGDCLQGMPDTEAFPPLQLGGGRQRTGEPAAREEGCASAEQRVDGEGAAIAPAGSTDTGAAQDGAAAVPAVVAADPAEVFSSRVVKTAIETSSSLTATSHSPLEVNSNTANIPNHRAVSTGNTFTAPVQPADATETYTGASVQADGSAGHPATSAATLAARDRPEPAAAAVSGADTTSDPDDPPVRPAASHHAPASGFIRDTAATDSVGTATNAVVGSVAGDAPGEVSDADVSEQRARLQASLAQTAGHSWQGSPPRKRPASADQLSTGDSKDVQYMALRSGLRIGTPVKRRRQEPRPPRGAGGYGRRGRPPGRAGSRRPSAETDSSCEVVAVITRRAPGCDANNNSLSAHRIGKWAARRSTGSDVSTTPGSVVSCKSGIGVGVGGDTPAAEGGFAGNKNAMQGIGSDDNSVATVGAGSEKLGTQDGVGSDKSGTQGSGSSDKSGTQGSDSSDKSGNQDSDSSVKSRAQDSDKSGTQSSDSSDKSGTQGTDSSDKSGTQGTDSSDKSGTHGSDSSDESGNPDSDISDKSRAQGSDKLLNHVTYKSGTQGSDKSGTQRSDSSDKSGTQRSDSSDKSGTQRSGSSDKSGTQGRDGSGKSGTQGGDISDKSGTQRSDSSDKSGTHESDSSDKSATQGGSSTHKLGTQGSDKSGTQDSDRSGALGSDRSGIQVSDRSGTQASDRSGTQASDRSGMQGDISSGGVLLSPLSESDPCLPSMDAAVSGVRPSVPAHRQSSVTAEVAVLTTADVATITTHPAVPLGTSPSVTPAGASEVPSTPEGVAPSNTGSAPLASASTAPLASSPTVPEISSAAVDVDALKSSPSATACLIGDSSVPLDTSSAAHPSSYPPATVPSDGAALLTPASDMPAFCTLSSDADRSPSSCGAAPPTAAAAATAAPAAPQTAVSDCGADTPQPAPGLGGAPPVLWDVSGEIRSLVSGGEPTEKSPPAAVPVQLDLNPGVTDPIVPSPDQSQLLTERSAGATAPESEEQQQAVEEPADSGGGPGRSPVGKARPEAGAVPPASLSEQEERDQSDGDASHADLEDQPATQKSPPGPAVLDVSQGGALDPDNEASSSEEEEDGLVTGRGSGAVCPVLGSDLDLSESDSSTEAAPRRSTPRRLRMCSGSEEEIPAAAAAADPSESADSTAGEQPNSTADSLPRQVTRVKRLPEDALRKANSTLAVNIETNYSDLTSDGTEKYGAMAQKETADARKSAVEVSGFGSTVTPDALVGSSHRGSHATVSWSTRLGISKLRPNSPSPASSPAFKIALKRKYKASKSMDHCFSRGKFWPETTDKKPSSCPERSCQTPSPRVTVEDHGTPPRRWLQARVLVRRTSPRQLWRRAGSLGASREPKPAAVPADTSVPRSSRVLSVSSCGASVAAGSTITYTVPRFTTVVRSAPAPGSRGRPRRPLQPPVWRCAYCSWRGPARDKELCQRHLRAHKYRCARCHIAFDTHAALQSHRLEMHRPDQVCGVCQREVRGSMERHQASDLHRRRQADCRALLKSVGRVLAAQPGETKLEDGGLAELVRESLGGQPTNDSAAPEPSMPALPDLEWKASSADGGVQQPAPAPAGWRSSDEPATPTRGQRVNSDTSPGFTLAASTSPPVLSIPDTAAPAPVACQPLPPPPRPYWWPPPPYHPAPYHPWSPPTYDPAGYAHWGYWPYPPPFAPYPMAPPPVPSPFGAPSAPSVSLLSALPPSVASPCPPLSAAPTPERPQPTWSLAGESPAPPPQTVPSTTGWAVTKTAVDSPAESLSAAAGSDDWDDLWLRVATGSDG